MGQTALAGPCSYFAGGSGLFDIEADAEYSQDAIQRAASSPWTDFVNNYAIGGEELLELLVDGVAMEWGAYNASHRYTLDVVPTGLPLDISANIYDTYAVNNTGGLCVALFYKDDTGPITSAVAVNPAPVASGASVTVIANVDDTTTGGSTIKSAEFSVDGGTWTPMTASDSGFDEIVEDVTGSFTAPLDGGSYDVCVRGTDDMPNTGDAACTSLTVYDAYAKISGTTGPTIRGGALAFSFSGWVATAGDEILGQISVNYRILRETCTYTPDGDSGLVIANGIAYLTSWQSSCASGEFDLTLLDRDRYPTRGTVYVNGPFPDTYDIGTLPGRPLATGNVHVVDLTVNDWADTGGGWVYYDAYGVDRQAMFSFGAAGGEFWYDDEYGVNAYHVTLTQGAFIGNTAYACGTVDSGTFIGNKLLLKATDTSVDLVWGSFVGGDPCAGLGTVTPGDGPFTIADGDVTVLNVP